MTGLVKRIVGVPQCTLFHVCLGMPTTVSVEVSLWSSVPFWPLICPDGCHLALFVKDWCDLPLFDTLFLPGRCTMGFFCSKPTSRVLGLQLDFNMPVGDPLFFS